MAVKTKAELLADIAALPIPITAADLQALLSDMVDSYEDLIQEFTMTQRDSLTPFYGQKILNTTTGRVEQYIDDWFPIGNITGNAFDGSGNANYPAGLIGDTMTIIGAGKIGGGSGKDIAVGDLIVCIGNNAGGDEASVGNSWKLTKSA